MTETLELPEFIDATNDNDEFVTLELKGVPLTNRIERDKATTRRFRVLDAFQTADGILLDGIDDRIDCGNHADLWSQGLTKFSWSLWIYPTVVGDTTRDIMRHGSSGAHRFRADINGTDGDVKWYIRNGANSADSTARVSGLMPRQLQNIVGTYDNSLGSANVKVYLNGVLGYQTANLTETINASQIMFLGGNSTDLQGYTFDFRFWKTVALTAQNALDLYGVYTEVAGESPSTEEPNIPAPDYWLPMNEGTGTPIDVIGDKTTTLNNGATWQNPSNIIRVKIGDEETENEPDPGAEMEGETGEITPSIQTGYRDIKVDDDTYEIVVSLM